MRNTYLLQVFAYAALLTTVAPTIAQTVSPNEIRFREARHKEDVEGDLNGAIKIYESITASKGDRKLAAKALVQLGRCYEKQGNVAARHAYERVLRDFSDQGAAVGEARLRLAKINPAAARTEIVARQLTPSLGIWPLRTVTRDGRYAAYIDMRRGILTVADLATGVTREVGGGRRLIASGEHSTSAAISPDGSLVAYSQIKADGTSDLRIIGVSGTEPRILQSGLKAFFIAEWSRDGGAVLIRQPEGALLVKVATGEGSPIPSQPFSGVALPMSQFRGAQIRLSPDGKLVADTVRERPTDRGTAVFVTPVGSNTPQRITSPEADAYVFGWSPDGQRLLYVSDESGNYDLWAVPIKSGKPTGVAVLLKKDLGQVYASGISDDGSLYYSSTTQVGNAYVGELDVAASTVSNVEQVPAPRGHWTGQATWSPDGSRLLLERRGESRSIMTIRDLTTGQEQEIKPPMGTYESQTDTNGRSLTDYRAVWAPDGKSVLFVIYHMLNQKPLKMVVADLETGTAKSELEVAQSRSHTYLLPVMAPDGRHVYITKGAGYLNASRVVRLNLQTGDEQEICAARPSTWALSPDGTQVACGGSGDSIRIIPVQGGPARDLVNGEGFGRGMTWTADGKHLIYTTARRSSSGPGSTADYWIVSAAGGSPRKLGIALDQIGFISVHPNNRRIAISSGGPATTDLWVLENVLRVTK
jgi:Tol biopolymer transport system component